jgi:DnaJ-class molecular chaperone
MSNVQENQQDTNKDPGDEAPPGTSGTGENLCPRCKGCGAIDGAKCENCGGSGRITEGAGGA